MMLPHFDHQLRALDASLRKEAFAYLMETGTGKTRVVLDRFAAESAARHVSQLLVVAPNGVHRNWITQELPKYWPTDRPVGTFIWRSGLGKGALAELEHFLVMPVPRILTINVEALNTPKGYALCVRFLQAARTLMVIDESTDIKSPSAARTRAAQRLGKFAAERVIMSGTPVAQGPLDLYSQFQFLRPGCLGAPNAAVFRATYAEWRERILALPGGGSRKYPELVRYRNLDQLKALVGRMSFVALKSELNLPPKLNALRPVVLGEEQRSAYELVRRRVLAEFQAGELTTDHALTKLLRLAQIVGGHLPLDDGTLTTLPNAKLTALEACIEELRADAQVVVWARFRAELVAIAQMLGTYGQVARFWGDNHATRDIEADEFKAGRRRFMVAQQQAGGKGHNWQVAEYVYFFSNDFSYLNRAQAEDRTHRIGTQHSVLYTDLVAEGTIDEKIIAAILLKQDVAAYFKSKTPEDFLS